MSNRVTPATLSTQKELINTLNSQSILLQLSYAQDKSVSKIKQELMQQLFYVSQETALKAKFDFQTNSANTLLADGKWNHAKPQQNGEEEEEDDQNSYEEVDDEMEEEQEDHIIEDDDVDHHDHIDEDDEDDIHQQPLSPSST